MLHIHWPVVRRMKNGHINRSSTETKCHSSASLRHLKGTQPEEKNDITSSFVHIFLKLHISLSTFSKASRGLTFCFNGNLRKSQANQSTWNQHRALECMELRTHNPWSKALLDKLTGSQIVKKFPAFYGTRRFVTAFTSARHKSLSLISSNQSMLAHPTS